MHAERLCLEPDPKAIITLRLGQLEVILMMMMRVTTQLEELTAAYYLSQVKP